MAAYLVTQDYRSGLGAFGEGQTVELDDELAAHIERDSPGTLVRVSALPETRTLDAPPADRMIKTARKRGA